MLEAIAVPIGRFLAVTEIETEVLGKESLIPLLLHKRLLRQWTMLLKQRLVMVLHQN